MANATEIDITPLAQEITRQELRSGWLGIDKPYQALDLFGTALGAYFIYHGATGRGSQWLTISLGAIMVWIHTRRFFLAPSDYQGLVRLARSLELSPLDLQRAAEELARQTIASGKQKGVTIDVTPEK